MHAFRLADDRPGKQFETAKAAQVGAKHAVAVNSGTAALHLAVEALGLGPGHAVLVPTMTFAATAEVVRYQGAVPLLVDCDLVTLNMDIEDAERKIEQLQAGQTPLDPALRVVGMIPVHVGGLMMDMEEVQAFATKHGLWVIEDAARSFPAAYRHSLSRPTFGRRLERGGVRSTARPSSPHLTLSRRERGPGVPFSAGGDRASWRRCGENTSAVTCFPFMQTRP